VGCASWNPKIGMTSAQFDNMCGLSFNGSSSVISAKNNIEVKRCEFVRGTIYKFENNRLVSIDRDSSPTSFSPVVIYSDSYDSDNSAAIRKLKRDALIQDEKRRFDKLEQENSIRTKEIMNSKSGQR
jgi:hypothetical protein